MVIIYKAIQYPYHDPVWQNGTCTLVPKQLTVIPGKFGRNRREDIITVAEEFGIQPVFFDGIDGDFLIVIRETSKYVTTVADVDAIFADPCPDNNCRIAHFDKRRRYGWLIWARNASDFGVDAKIKVFSDGENVFKENGDWFMSECDYLDAHGEFSQIPYVKEIIHNFTNDLIVPANWLKFGYGMCVVMDFYTKYLSLKGDSIRQAAWNCTLHGKIK